MTGVPLKLATSLSVAAIGGLVSIAPLGMAQPAAPKLYVGLFGDNAIGVIDSATDRMIKTIPVAAGPHGLVMSPDGRTVYASSDGDSVVSVISTDRDEVTGTIDVGPTPHGLAITPDGGRVLVAGFGTNQVEAIDVATNQIAWETQVPQPHNIAITPDGKTAYAGSQAPDAPSLFILDVASGTANGSVPLDHIPRALVVTPDARDVDLTEAGVDSLQVLDRDTNAVETQIPTGASPHHPVFTADGRTGLVVAQGPGELDLFDPASNSPTGSVKVGDMPHWIAISSDNHFAFVSNEKANSVSVVDLTTDTLMDTVSVGAAPRKLVLQPGGVPMMSHAPAQPTLVAPIVPTLVSAAPRASDAATSIASFAFAPANITLSSGQQVTWTNTDAVDHTVTADTGGWGSGPLSSGATYSMTFTQPGTYAYHCSIHPFMRGTVVVR